MVSVAKRAPGSGSDAIERVRSLLAHVRDPEIPVLTIDDLGVLRDVRFDGATIEVLITPTYSGCPAMNAIEDDIRRVLDENGFADARISTVLSPPWTTDWMSAAGRDKLRDFGIAPPVGASADKRSLFGPARPVACPRCASQDTEKLSEFGSTACKALYRCRHCLEPFDYFKCI